MTYRFLRDATYVIFADDKYKVRMSKVVAPNGVEPVEFVYARIDVNALGEENDISKCYYFNNPITLQNINFRAYTGTDTRLKTSILNSYPSNIELAILLEEERTGYHRHILPGQAMGVNHELQPTIRQWGPWLQRAVRVPTDELVVMLAFPPDTVSLVTGKRLVGGSSRTLLPRLRHRGRRDWDIWYWRKLKPSVLDHYRFVWEFLDHREQGVAEEIRSAYERLSHDNTFALESDGRHAVWNGELFSFSLFQGDCMLYLVQALVRGTSMVHEQEILRQINSNSKRLRDLFKGHPAWGKLIKYDKAYIKLNLSQDQIAQITTNRTRK